MLATSFSYPRHMTVGVHLLVALSNDKALRNWSHWAIVSIGLAQGPHSVVFRLNTHCAWSSLCSTEQGLLHVPFAGISHRQKHALPVVGHLIWNGLLLTLCSHHRTLSQAFHSQLKMVLFDSTGAPLSSPLWRGAIQIVTMNEWMSALWGNHC